MDKLPDNLRELVAVWMLPTDLFKLAFSCKEMSYLYPVWYKSMWDKFLAMPNMKKLYNVESTTGVFGQLPRQIVSGKIETAAQKARCFGKIQPISRAMENYTIFEGLDEQIRHANAGISILQEVEHPDEDHRITVIQPIGNIPFIENGKQLVMFCKPNRSCIDSPFLWDFSRTGEAYRSVRDNLSPIADRVFQDIYPRKVFPQAWRNLLDLRPRIDRDWELFLAHT